MEASCRAELTYQPGPALSDPRRAGASCPSAGRDKAAELLVRAAGDIKGRDVVGFSLMRTEFDAVLSALRGAAAEGGGE